MPLHSLPSQDRQAGILGLLSLTTPVLRKEHLKMAKKRIVCGFAIKSTDLAFAECFDEDNALFRQWPRSPLMIKGPASLLDGSWKKSLKYIVTFLLGNFKYMNLPLICVYNFSSQLNTPTLFCPNQNIKKNWIEARPPPTFGQISQILLGFFEGLP